MEKADNKQPGILIADDLQKNIQVIGTILRKEGFQINVAVNGKQALDLAEKNLTDSSDSADSANSPNILIHCFMGSSRSASILVAYNSLINNIPIEDSIRLIKKKRDVVFISH